jgi:hypothetical protein
VWTQVRHNVDVPDEHERQSPGAQRIEQLRVLGTALPLIGLSVYGIALIGYDQFYERLGTNPDTVGVGYAMALARAAPTLVAAALLTVACFALTQAKKLQRWKHGIVWVLVGGAGLGLLTLLVLIFFRAYANADHVRHGAPISSFHVFWLPFIDTSVYRVKVNWIGPSNPPAVLSRPGLLFLGIGSGDVVLFDPRSGAVVRVPSADVVLAANQLELEGVSSD